jgi:peptidoglycan hydrolase CwlO-like protein
MYKKILLGLLVSTAAVYSVEGTDNLFANKLNASSDKNNAQSIVKEIFTYINKVVSESKYQNKEHQDQVQKDIQGMFTSMVSKLNDNGLEYLRQNKTFLLGQISSTNIRVQITKIITKLFQDSNNKFDKEKFKGSGTHNWNHNAEKKVDGPGMKDGEQPIKRIKEEEEEKKHSSEPVVPGALNIPNISGEGTPYTPVQPKKLVIPEAFSRASQKPEVNRVSSRQSAPEDSSSLISPREHQQQSSDAQAVSVAIQADLQAIQDELKKSDFMDKLKEAMTQLLEKYKNQTDKEREVQGLNEQLSRVQAELDEAQKRIAMGNDELESAKLAIDMLKEEIDQLAESKRNQSLLQSVSSNIHYTQEYLDMFLNATREINDYQKKTQASDQVQGAKVFLGNALANYQEAEAKMTNLSNEMITIVNKINELGQ